MEIKIEKSLLKVIAVVAIVLIAWFVWTKRTSAPTVSVASSMPAMQPSVQSVQSQASGQTKENTGGEVSVSVTPVIAGDPELGFDIATNTHTVDMSAFDPKKQVVLVGADRKEVLPSNVSVEGSGHHQRLQITFPKVESPWKLVVRDVGGIPAREFAW